MILRCGAEGCEVQLKSRLRLFLLISFMMAALLLSGCATETMKQQDTDSYDKQNREALSLISEERYDEAIAVLEDILEKDIQNNAALNSMALALFNLERYDEAKTYIDGAMAVLPNSTNEYVNLGNIQFQISDDVQLAMDAYDQAIALDGTIAEAYYGKALVCDYLGDYENAISLYSQYILKVPDDPDAHERLIYALLELDRIDEALTQITWFEDKGEYRHKRLILKASCAFLNNNLSDALMLSSDYLLYGTVDEMVNRADWEIFIGYVLSRGDYDFAIDREGVYAEMMNSWEAYIAKADACMWLNRYEDAEEACKMAIAVDPDAPEAYNLLGDVYASRTRYNDAIQQYTLAFDKDPEYTLARSNMIWAMYQAEYYDELIALVHELEASGEADSDDYYYLASAYSAIFDYDDAIDYFLKAFDLGGNSSDICYQIAWHRMLNQNYDQAREYNRRALMYNPRNADAQYLSEELSLLLTPIGNQAAEFIEKYYLYQDYVEDYESKLAAIRQCTSPDELEKALNAFFPEGDYFSFVIKGEEYRSYMDMKEEATVHFEEKRSISGIAYPYIKIDSFTPKTALEFKEAIKDIPDKQDQILVIDLRDNTGGDMKACSEILDELLGDCVTVSFLDRDGYQSQYTSTSDQTVFKKIVILQNEYTASASELLILGLYQYSDNLVLIGEKTYGKGVCQLVLDFPENEFALFLVNAYWNVREANIDYYGIQPHHAASTPDDYETVVGKILLGTN